MTYFKISQCNVLLFFLFFLHFITLFILLLSTAPPSRCCTFRNRSAGLMAVFVPLLDTEGPLLIEWNTCSPSRPTRTPQLILLRSLAKSHAFWASYYHCALITILQVADQVPKGGTQATWVPPFVLTVSIFQKIVCKVHSIYAARIGTAFQSLRIIGAITFPPLMLVFNANFLWPMVDLSLMLSLFRRPLLLEAIMKGKQLE